MIDLLKEIEKFVILLEYSYSDCILLFFFSKCDMFKSQQNDATFTLNLPES